MATPVATRDVGDVAVITLDLARAGVPTDPTTLTLRQRKPNAATTQVFPFDSGEQGTQEKPLVRTGLGTFKAEMLLDASGTWIFGCEATGPVEAYNEVQVNVRGRRT